jgi:hypothetical protein
MQKVQQKFEIFFEPGFSLLTHIDGFKGDLTHIDGFKGDPSKVLIYFSRVYTSQFLYNFVNKIKEIDDW